MIKVSFSWHGDEALAQVKSIGWERLQRCIVFFWQACQAALNVSNPRPYKTPSKPGEPPRKRTGWGQRHVVYELDKEKLQGRVGLASGAIYMLYHEFKNRSWLLSTLRKVEGQLNAIAGG